MLIRRVPSFASCIQLDRKRHSDVDDKAAGEPDPETPRVETPAKRYRRVGSCEGPLARTAAWDELLDNPDKSLMTAWATKFAGVGDSVLRSHIRHVLSATPSSES